jgi:hypothetical protein
MIVLEEACTGREAERVGEERARLKHGIIGHPGQPTDRGSRELVELGGHVSAETADRRS